MGKAGKWLTLVLTGVLVLALVAAGGLYWRLRQGPVHLPALMPYVHEALDNAVAKAGMKVRFRDVVLEIDEHQVPTMRLRDISLRTADGRQVAAAPRAALSFSGKALLDGRLVAKRLDLERPRLRLRRGVDGSFSIDIGMDGQATENAGSPAPDGDALLASIGTLLRRADAAGKSDDAGDDEGLESLEISDAEIVLMDEALGIRWRAPAADLVLRSVPYGYALLATAQVHGAGRPWRVELSASWRRETGRASLSVQLRDVHLADLLSSLFPSAAETWRRLRLPLSGRLDFELQENGSVLAASGELLMGRGEIVLPEVLPQALKVREGLVLASYDSTGGAIVIKSGRLVTDQGTLEVAGLVRPVSAPNGGVQALDLDLNVRNERSVAGVKDDGMGIVPWRRAALKMRLHTRLAQVEIGDLQLFAGAGAVRLRGMLRAEAEGVGIYVSGRARNISHRLLKATWPKKIGAGARQWIGENVRAGTIDKATFRLAIPANVLRAAIERDRPMPEKVADVRFSVRDARFTYVDGWPAIAGASGRGVMTGNTFRLTLKRGRSRLPSGQGLTLLEGELRARDLAAKVSPGEIRVRAKGRAEGFLELADMPPLRLVREMGMNGGRLRGDVVATLRLKMPFSRKMTGEDIRVVSLDASVANFSTRGLLLPGLELGGGKLTLKYADGLLLARGRGRVSGVPLRFEWRRKFGRGVTGDDAKARLVLRTTLDDATRKRLGLDLSAWMQGPVSVETETRLGNGGARKFRVKAGLDKVRMKLPAIGWSREAKKGTEASFDLILGEKKGVRVERLSLAGPDGLRIAGRLRLDAGGNFREATFSRFELNANNRLALGLEREKERLKAQAAGPMFDARPLITRLFATRREVDKALRSVFVRVNIREVLALRGERIRDVRGEVEVVEGLVRRASLTGRFASSGRKILLELVPANNGLRRLFIATEDAGALLRASGLYSRIVGGRAEFTALLKGGEDGGVQRGLLVMRHFMVRGDERLSRIRRKDGRNGVARGPRRGQRFTKLVLPFSTDRHFIRIGDALIKSPEIGGTANGLIRRADGAMDVGGVIIPAYALNAALGKIPVLGMLLTGGKGQGVFGMTYALKGSISRPKFIVNPLSAVAPGVLRHFFQLGGNQVNPDGTPKRRGERRRRPRSRTNIINGG